MVTERKRLPRKTDAEIRKEICAFLRKYKHVRAPKHFKDVNVRLYQEAVKRKLLQGLYEEFGFTPLDFKHTEEKTRRYLQANPDIRTPTKFIAKNCSAYQAARRGGYLLKLYYDFQFRRKRTFSTEESFRIFLTANPDIRTPAAWLKADKRGFESAHRKRLAHQLYRDFDFKVGKTAMQYHAHKDRYLIAPDSVDLGQTS